MERIEMMSLRLGDGRSDAAAPTAMPFEVRDFSLPTRTISTCSTAPPKPLATQAQAQGDGLAHWLAQRA